jgi:hypothetical protein
MKKYNRAQEKRNDLISVINYTTFESNDNTTEKPKRKGPKGQSESCETSRGITNDNRKCHGKRENKPRRNSAKNRSSKVQHQQDNEAEISCKHRFSCKDGRKYRLECRIKSQKGQRLIDGDCS